MLPDSTFQLSFRATGDTGVLSSSTGAPAFIGGKDVSRNGCMGAGFVVRCCMRGGDAGSPVAAEGVVSVDILQQRESGLLHSLQYIDQWRVCSRR